MVNKKIDLGETKDIYEPEASDILDYEKEVRKKQERDFG